MYIKLPNIYPYSITNLYSEYPNTSFPADILSNYAVLSNYQIYPVNPTNKPEYNTNTQKLVENVEYDNNAWYQNWTITNLTPEEQSYIISNKAAEARAFRNRLLIESDWTQFKDINPQISNNWAPYRQQLRDITTQPGFPFEVVWPNLPT